MVVVEKMNAIEIKKKEENISAERGEGKLTVVPCG